MANKSQSEEQPTVDFQTGIRLLREQLEEGRRLLGSRPLNEDEYAQWKLVTGNYLEKAFGRGSPNVSQVMDVGRYGGVPQGATEGWYEERRARNLQTQLTRIVALVQLLHTEVELQQTKTISAPTSTAHGHRIFLVHGSDGAVIHETARFLERLEQEVVILREQPNQGRTIIEKFEDYGDVGFAVVLLTADDRGGRVDVSFELQKPRARQNVVLELGYFLGKLGRSRVCALYREGVEIPSDYSGVLYVKLDADGAWRLQLAKELRAAGFRIDMNKAL